MLTPDLLTRVLLTPDLLTHVLLTPDLVAVAVCAVDRGGVYDSGGGERARGRRDLPRPRQHGRGQRSAGGTQQGNISPFAIHNQGKRTGLRPFFNEKAYITEES